MVGVAAGWVVMACTWAAAAGTAGSSAATPPAATPPAAPPPASDAAMEAAKAHIRAVKFRDAEKALEASPPADWPRAKAVDWHWLRALTFYALGRTVRLDGEFDAILALEPLHVPARTGVNPDLRRGFYLRQALLEERLGLEWTELGWRGALLETQVRTKGDVPLNLWAHVAAADLEAELGPAPFSGGNASLLLDRDAVWQAAGAAGQLRLWLELRDGQGAVYARRGTREAPLVVGIPEQHAEEALGHLASIRLGNAQGNPAAAAALPVAQASLAAPSPADKAPVVPAARGDKRSTRPRAGTVPTPAPEAAPPAQPPKVRVVYVSVTSPAAPSSAPDEDRDRARRALVQGQTTFVTAARSWRQPEPEPDSRRPAGAMLVSLGVVLGLAAAFPFVAAGALVAAAGYAAVVLSVQDRGLLRDRERWTAGLWAAAASGAAAAGVWLVVAAASVGLSVAGSAVLALSAAPPAQDRDPQDRGASSAASLSPQGSTP